MPHGGPLGLGGEFLGSGLCCLALAALAIGVMQAFGALTDAALLLVAASLVLAVMALKTGLRMAGRAWWVVATVIVGLTNLLYPRLGGPFAYHVGAQVALALDEHSEYRWCGFDEAGRLMMWEGSKAALERLGRLLCPVNPPGS